MHSKFGLFQMSSLSLCAALSKVNFVVYYRYMRMFYEEWADLDAAPSIPLIGSTSNLALASAKVCQLSSVRVL